MNTFNAETGHICTAGSHWIQGGYLHDDDYDYAMDLYTSGHDVAINGSPPGNAPQIIYCERGTNNGYWFGRPVNLYDTMKSNDITDQDERNRLKYQFDIWS